MWTPSIVSVEKKGRTVEVVVAFDNSGNATQNFAERFSLTSLAALKAAVRDRLTQVTTVHTLADTLTTGAFDIAPVTQTQEEIDRMEFMQDYSKLQRFRRAIDLGLLTGNEAQVTNLINKIKAEFKPAYFDII